MTYFWLIHTNYDKFRDLLRWTENSRLSLRFLHRENHRALPPLFLPLLPSSPAEVMPWEFELSYTNTVCVLQTNFADKTRFMLTN